MHVTCLVSPRLAGPSKGPLVSSSPYQFAVSSRHQRAGGLSKSRVSRRDQELIRLEPIPAVSEVAISFWAPPQPRQSLSVSLVLHRYRPHRQARRLSWRPSRVYKAVSMDTWPRSCSSFGRPPSQFRCSVQAAISPVQST